MGTLYAAYRAETTDDPAGSHGYRRDMSSWPMSMVRGEPAHLVMQAKQFANLKARVESYAGGPGYSPSWQAEENSQEPTSA
jgi:hypothetical protein